MSKELFENLLASFKRSNKERRAKLAQKAGYETPEEYKIYLENEIAGVPAKKTTKKVPAKKELVKKDAESFTDMVFAFDTTGSMSDYINAVKKHVKELIPTLLKQNPNLKISVVAFGDYCDMERKAKDGFGKAYQVIGLTNDENALINFVVNAKDTGGGDGDEFYELVIKKITEETEWRDGSSKSVVLIGDADPHRPGYIYDGVKYNIDWEQEAQKAAIKGVVFDTLRIHSNSWYQKLSQITNGVCLPFSNSSKTSQVLEATSLARGGATTKDAFFTKSMSAEVKNDAELDAVYSMYKTTT